MEQITVTELLAFLFDNFAEVQLGIDAGLLAVILFLGRKYYAYRALVRTMVVESTAVPTPPAKLKQWKDTLSGLPEGSAKRGAYIKAIRDAEDQAELLRKTSAATVSAQERKDAAEKALVSAQLEYDKVTNGD